MIAIMAVWLGVSTSMIVVQHGADFSVFAGRLSPRAVIGIPSRMVWGATNE